MIPVGTSVNPGELRSGPKWEKTFILCLGVPDTSPGTHIVYMWTPCSFHMDSVWYLSGQNVVTTLTPYGIQVDTT